MAIYGRTPSSSSFPTFDGSYSSSKKDKDEEHGSLYKYTLGTAGNLLDDIGDFATGFFPGMKHIITSVGDDQLNILRGRVGGLDDLKTDDIIGGIIEDYRYTYGPLKHGDFKEFGKRVSEHPLGPILDVLSLVSLGGGLVAKGASLSAKAGKAGRAAELAVQGSKAPLSHRVAGLESHGLVDRNLSTVDRAAFGQRVKRDGGLITPEGEVLRPKKLEFDTDLGRSLEVTAKRNPVKRAGQKAFGNLGSTQALRNVPAIGSNRRVARAERKRSDADVLREEKKATRVADRLIRKHVKKPAQMAAVRVMASNHGVDDWVSAYKSQLSKLDASKESEAVDVARIEKRIQELQDPEVRRLVDESPDELRQVVEELKGVQAQHDALLDELLSGDGAERVRNRRAVEADFLGKAVDDEALIWPHAKDLHDALLDEFRPASGKKSKSGAMQKNEGINVRLARESLDPRVVVASYRDTLKYAHSMKRIETMMSLAKPIRAGEGVPSGWKVINSPEVKAKFSDVDEILDFFEEDLRAMAGADNPQLNEAISVMEKFIDNISSDDVAYALPERVIDDLSGQFRKSRRFILRFAQNATDFWRYLTLPLRPAWITANFVGQLTLLLATHGVFKSVKSYAQLLKHGKIADDLMPDVLSGGLVRTTMSDAKRAAKGDSLAARAMRLARKPGDALSSFNAIVTDDMPRRAAFLTEIRPYAKQIQKETGLSFEDAAKRLLDEPGVVDEISRKVLDDLVDFRDMSAAERQYIRPFIPFYSWIKGATRRTGRLVVDDPHKALVGMVAGREGVQHMQEQFGELPDYAYGLIPVGERDGDQQRVLAGYSWNPFQTPGDVAGQLKTTLLDGEKRFGGENPLTSINPVLKSGIEAVFGYDLFYGQPIRDLGDEPMAQTWAKRFGASFPQYQTYRKARDADEDIDYTPLYERSALWSIMQYLGLPLKTMNVSVANDRAEKDSQVNI